MSAVIRAIELARTFQSSGAAVLALRGISLSIEEGEFVAVMGPSGSGKSTLMNLLGGLDTPTAGEVYIGDQRVDNLSEGRRAVLRRWQVGIVFQAFNLIGNLSAADNVELPALIAGVSPREARGRRETLFEQLGISDKAGEIPGSLSGGQQQRVAISRALVNEPAVLLADEPTGNLDTQSAREVVELLRGYNSAGQTIVMVTHDPRVASAAGRVVQMRDGWITEETRLGEGQDTRELLSSLVDLED